MNFSRDVVDAAPADRLALIEQCRSQWTFGAPEWTIDMLTCFRIGAVVLPGSEGYGASDRLARELHDHAKGQAPPYRYPRLVEFVFELPKTSSGKVKRALLRQAYAWSARPMTDDLRTAGAGR
jgi:acyl-coenzyme A synthetase/AMP-(fatty) acid ligase